MVAHAERLDLLVDFVARHKRLFVLSGAGVSTDSGIPGYRDDEGRWNRSAPVTHQDFLAAESVRRRYWMRSMIGWPRVARAEPNAAHTALAGLQAGGKLSRLVTQNVDGLHQRAGSVNVLELHGNLGGVVCLRCGHEHSRQVVQRSLEQANGEFLGAPAATAPDGDADPDDRDLDAFQVPTCIRCAGTLKPDVVFFGDNVPRARVAAAMTALDEADAVLVVGSSLMVYSGFRFCERAHRAGKPIAAINRGRTRADDLISLKVEAPCAPTLSALVLQLALA